MPETPGLVYAVRDRSILLPHFKRFVVEPSLRFLPARLHPNVITHVGHLANLAGCLVVLLFAGHGAGPFVVAAALLNFYNWCDNADGGHARRTGQCSAGGELLDHGLDMLNTTYIALVSAVAVGASPEWTALVAISVPAACAVTYWEQAETGLFSLGLLTQIEAVALLTTILAVDAIFGVEIWTRLHVGPVTLRLAMTTFACATALIGMAGNVRRVWKKRGAVRWVYPLLAFDAAVIAAMFLGALGPLAAVIVGSAGNVFFGLRSLALRTMGRKPRPEAGLVIAAMMLVALSVVSIAGLAFGRTSDIVASAYAVLFFGAYAAINTRESTRAVARLDRRTSSG